jgi:hypothetical protein
MHIPSSVIGSMSSVTRLPDKERRVPANVLLWKCGSPPDRPDFDADRAIEALIYRGVRPGLARVKIEALASDPAEPVVVHVPRMDHPIALAMELLISGIRATPLIPAR